MNVSFTFWERRKTLAFEFIMDGVFCSVPSNGGKALNFTHTWKILNYISVTALHSWPVAIGVFDKLSITQVLLRSNLGPHFPFSIPLAKLLSIPLCAERKSAVQQMLFQSFCLSSRYEYNHRMNNTLLLSVLINQRSKLQTETHCMKPVKVIVWCYTLSWGSISFFKRLHDYVAKICLL